MPEIVTPTTREMSSDGGQTWEAFDPARTVQYGETWRIREIVTDTDGNSATFTSEPITVVGLAPSRTVSLGAVVDGQTVGQPGSGADVEAVLGGAAGVPDDPLTWEIDVDGGGYASLGSPYEAAEGEVLTIRISDPDHPAGPFSASSAPVTVGATVVPDTLEITALTFVEGQDGAIPRIEITGSYGGSQPLTLFVVSYQSASGAPTVPQAVAGTGGTVLDAGNLPGFDFALGAAGALSDFFGGNGADSLMVVVREDGGDNQAATATVAVTNLDEDGPDLVSAATSLDGTQATLTFDDIIVGDEDPADWTVTGSASGAIAVTGVTIDGSADVVLAFGGAVQAGETLAVDYAGGTLRDDWGNALQDLADEAVTNNVPPAGFDPAALFAGRTGYVFDPAAGVYTDTGLSIPATVGQTVQGWASQSGVGSYDATGAAGPQLGSGFVTFDRAAGEKLDTAGGFDASIDNRGFFLAAAFRPATTGTTQHILACQPGGPSKLFLLRHINFGGDGLLQFIGYDGAKAGVTAQDTTAIVAGEDVIVMAWLDASFAKICRGGKTVALAEVGSAANAAGTISNTGSPHTLGALNAGDHLDGRAYFLLASTGIPTAQERAELYTHMQGLLP
ncbi:hypothetical protein SAMN05444722_1677 [Rhodovulum sp. ES.010]|uniref:hypothetical protein n=1 Tax=Rhodovulum sp. ES.010 TaxID=1882821 RepID=UPI00092822E6|nr:hypothetical protein [Rhodovulum sp. ES.010]SIO36283.1 hypothetical protein SAMN05444722_1677 [Rhodovulum sp. ES.010]